MKKHRLSAQHSSPERESLSESTVRDFLQSFPVGEIASILRTPRVGQERSRPSCPSRSAMSGVHPMIEKYPLNRVAEACEQMHSGKARFRAVLTM